MRWIKQMVDWAFNKLFGKLETEVTSSRPSTLNEANEAMMRTRNDLSKVRGLASDVRQTAAGFRRIDAFSDSIASSMHSPSGPR